MLKHYVDFSFPGAFFSEHSVEEVAERTPELLTVPENCFAYRFFDKSVEVIDGETLEGKAKNYSPFTYFGTAYTLEEVKKNFPTYTTLIANMEGNGWARVVKTRCGNWQPLSEGDIVI